MPPLASPPNRFQLYFPVLRIMAASGHHLQKRDLELIHFLLCPYRYPHVSGPTRPDTSDVDLLLAERQDDLLARPLHIDHEFVGHRRHVLEVVLIEETQDILPDVLDRFTAFGNQVLDLETRSGGDHRSDGHRPGAKGRV